MTWNQRWTVIGTLAAGMLIGGALVAWQPGAVAESAYGTKAAGLEPAPAFTLTDTNGQTHSLSDFHGKHVVLEWINPECPFVKKFYNAGKMQELQAKYTDEGVVWLLIDSSAPGKQGDLSADEWNSKMEEQGIKATALLLDDDGTVGRAYGAKTTPHMYVINPDGKLIYQGAIDDQPTPDSASLEIAHNYVAQVLDANLLEQTKPYGCSVKY